MIILISNDDGMHSPGIKALEAAMKCIKGATVYTVAPDAEQSAASHAITLHRPLRVTKMGVRRYGVKGTPTDSVMLAVHHLLKKRPDLIVSGINLGANLGEDVHYSGTVSAALEGAIMGIPSIAFSLVGEAPFNFDKASSFATSLAKKVLKEGLPKGVVLNVNIPNLPAKDVKGYEICKLGKHNYGDVIVENKDPRGRPYFWIGGDPFDYEDSPDTDCKAQLNHKISVTPIKVDLTDYKFLKEIEKWKI